MLTRLPSIVNSRLRQAIHNLNDLHSSLLLHESLRCDSHLTISERKALYRLAFNKCSIVEIGSYLGASACCFAAAPRHKDRSVYCIDTWSNDAMTEGRWDTWQMFRNNTSKFSSSIVPLRGWSTEMAQHLARYIQTIDLLFVDGAHDYDSVKADWESYKVFLEVGSIIVFHDFGWAEGVQAVVNEDVKGLTLVCEALPNMWWGILGKKP